MADGERCCTDHAIGGQLMPHEDHLTKMEKDLKIVVWMVAVLLALTIVVAARVYGIL
jgi:hypothetical protein